MSFLKSLFKREEIRTRIAPSPTGPFHIGGARTALFNFLFARKHGGKFILRIEDTDLERSDPKYEADIIENLKWLGLNWDEGPYRQSERLNIYNECLKKLLKENQAFYCFHSKEHLEKTSLHRCDFKKLPLEIALKRLNREKAIVRFKTPLDKRLCFNDLIRGEICFNSSALGGDFSLAKALAPNKFSPLYNFAVVVDDHFMKISHVIRGEDHISNTPKQILIAKTLGFSLPQFGHLPLVLGPDKSKLSKRHGATSVAEYRKAGYLPEAIINFLAMLGWNPGTDKEIFSLKELINDFDLTKVSKSGAVFNIEKLDWLNGYYLNKLTLDELTGRIIPFLIKDSLIEKDIYSFEYIKKIIALEQPRLKKLNEIGERASFFFKMPSYEPELLVWRDMSFKDVFTSLNVSLHALESIDEAGFNKTNLEEVLLKEAEKAKKNDKGRLLWPLRVALTGLKASPPPFEILEILGKTESLKRIKSAVKKLA